jgi:hypothetical protein
MHDFAIFRRVFFSFLGFIFEFFYIEGLRKWPDDPGHSVMVF